MNISCQLFTQEGQEWKEVGYPEISKFRLSFSISSKSFKLEGESDSHKTKFFKEFFLNKISNLCRFSDRQDGRPCFQFVDNFSEEEFGIKMNSDEDADEFGVSLVQYMSKSEQGILVFHEHVAGFYELVRNEKIPGSVEWKKVSDDLSAIVVTLSQRESDFESFLTISQIKNDGSLLSPLFNANLSNSLNMNFSDFPLVSFFGSSPAEENLRIFGLKFPDTKLFASFKECTGKLLKEKSVKSRVSPSWDFRDCESDDEKTDSDEDEEETDYQPAKPGKREDAPPPTVVLSKRRFSSRKNKKDKPFSNRLLEAGNSALFVGQEEISRVSSSSSFPFALRCLRDTRDEDELLREGEILAKFPSHLFPQQVMPYHSDRSVILTQPKNDSYNLSLMDVETGRVVRSWGGDEAQGIFYSCPINSTANISNDNRFLALGPKSILTLDTRQGERNSNISDKSRLPQYVYSSNVRLSCLSSDSQGRLAVASRTGQIRLFDGKKNVSGDIKRAKSLIEGLGDPVSHIEISHDGKWLLCTCQSYLVLICVEIEKDERKKTGFEVSLKNDPSMVVTLSVKPTDLVKYGISSIHFSPAKFLGDNKSIVSASGSVEVVWDFKKAKKGISEYELFFKSDFVVATTSLTQNSTSSSIVTMYEDSLELSRPLK